MKSATSAHRMAHDHQAIGIDAILDLAFLGEVVQRGEQLFSPGIREIIYGVRLYADDNKSKRGQPVSHPRLFVSKFGPTTGTDRYASPSPEAGIGRVVDKPTTKTIAGRNG